MAQPDDPLAREYAAARKLIEEHQLAERVPRLSILLDIAGTAGTGSLQAKTCREIIDMVNAHLKSKVVLPFSPRLSQVPMGSFPWTADKRSGLPLLFDPVDLASHTLVAGSTGSGKTMFVIGLVHQLKASDPTVDVCYVDPNDDFQALAVQDEHCMIFTEDTPLCLTVTPSFLRQEFFDQLKAKIFADVFYGALNVQRLFADTEKAVREQRPFGYNFKMIRDAIARVPMKGMGYTERDTRTNTIARLDTIAAVLPGLYEAKPPECLTLEDLCHRPVYFRLKNRLTAYQFPISLWTSVRLHFHEAKRHTGLRTLIVMDEGLTLWQSENAQRISNSALLDHAVSQSRAKGVGFLITTTSMQDVSRMVKANTNLQVVMRLVDGSEVEEARRTFRLSNEATTYLYERLVRGEAFLRMSHKYPETMLVTFPESDKPILLPKEFERIAAARTRALLPARPVVTPDELVTMVRERMKSGFDDDGDCGVTLVTGNPPPLSEPEPISFDDLDVADDELPNVVNRNEQRMIDYLHTAVIDTVHATNLGAGLTASQGNQCQASLAQKAFLTVSESIKTGSGRGKQGIPLMLTAAGAKYAQTKPGKHSNGCGPQTQYLIQKIARALGEADGIDLNVNGKKVDIGFAFHHAKHAAFLRILNDAGAWLGGSTPVIVEGELIALEIDQTAATVLNNYVKGMERGVKVLVFAVMPAAMKPVRKLLLAQPGNHAGIAVVDALLLLDSLSSKASRSNRQQKGKE